MTPEQLQAIEDRWAKATRGPWHWDVNKSCKFVSLESNRHVAMGFKRYGMGGAQPTFLGEYALEPAEMLAVPRKANHPNFDMDINHPTAQAIASAPTDIADLLAEVERMRCCGNCAYYRFEVPPETLKTHEAYVGNKLVTFIEAGNPSPEKICFMVNGSGVCDNWEA